MPKNDLDLDYSSINPATTQPGESVTSSGGTASYVVNPEALFLFGKKPVSAMQYRNDVSYDIGDNVWDGNGVNPRLLFSKTDADLGNALPIDPVEENTHWKVFALDWGLPTARFTISSKLPPDASTTVKGVSEFATSTETADHVDDSRGITPKGLFDSGVGTVNIVHIKASGIYNRPDNVRAIFVLALAAGGGGGGVDGDLSEVASAGGGGGGGFSHEFIASPDPSYTVTIGLGGVGGVGPNNGSTGGDTLFGFALQPRGGLGGGGVFATATQDAREGGDGGVSNLGDVFTDGQPGGTGITLNGSSGHGVSGYGASSQFGSGAPGLTSALSEGKNGGDGSGFGSGGAGAFARNFNSNFSGGDGANGLIIIWEFF